jgi:muramoyltetrapeptide carboxypeptidase
MKAGVPSESEAVTRVRKPRALRGGSRVLPFGPASPADPQKVSAGLQELRRLGLEPLEYAPHAPQGFVAGTTEERRTDLLEGLRRDDVDALFGIRGGYGSNYLLDDLTIAKPDGVKVLLGYSDLTSLQVFLWQRHGWVTTYGPMIAAGFDFGAGNAKGYEVHSLESALFQIEGTWTIGLQGEAMSSGVAEGRVLGGCMTLVETTLGTPWELDTRDAILLLEDRGMKPWQVDRALMHLLQAGKFAGVRGIVLGDFPDCEPPANTASVREVCVRILGALGIPVVYGAPVGHTTRPLLTVPLGVRARLEAKGEGTLEILEPAVMA